MFKIPTLTGHCALGAAVAAAALSGCATYPGDQKSDAQITSAIEQSLATHPELGPPGGLQVETYHHVVYLNGVVYSDMQRDIANSAALIASNNAPVVNSIAVNGK
jgi:osmotically-inducible protein OsmY